MISSIDGKKRSSQEREWSIVVSDGEKGDLRRDNGRRSDGDVLFNQKTRRSSTDSEEG
jgi:hypothetical protein